MTESGFPSIEKLLRRHAAATAATGSTLLLEVGLRCATPLAAVLLIDRAVGARAGSVSAAFFIVAVTVAGALAAGILRDLAYASLQSRMMESVRDAVYGALQNSFGDSGLPALQADLDLVEATLGSMVLRGAQPLLEGIVATAIALWLDWRVGSVSILVWLFVLLAPHGVANRAREADDQRRKNSAKLLDAVSESLRAWPTIRAFSLEEQHQESFRASNRSLTRVAARAGLLAAFSERFTISGLLFLQMLALTLSAWLTHRGEMTPGAVVGLQILIGMLGTALLSVKKFAPQVPEGKLVWHRLSGRVGQASIPHDPSAVRHLEPLAHEIFFSKVKCSAESSPVLNTVTARIPRGTHVAFVGPSGSGKSMLLRLLMRFQEPDGGTVSIDGHDLKKVSVNSLRRQIGAVLQETFVFNTSLLENIRLGRPEASGEKVLGAARAAGLAELSTPLPDGLDTVLGGPIRLSPLNVQRLALARALVAEPGILLLDEMSSSLDPADETVLTETVQAVARGRTVVSATHRLSSTADADLIYVMGEGRIVEQGSHYELMALNGTYAELWHKQAGFRFSEDGRHVDVDAQRLRRLPVLEKLSEEILAELAPFFATENFPQGRDIVRQNDPGDKFFIIVRGKVEVWRTDEQSGSTLRVAVLQDGDYFGEITLITGFPRTATVRTATPATCISLERGQFVRLMERFPELSREISETAMKRFMESSRAVRYWQ